MPDSVSRKIQILSFEDEFIPSACELSDKVFGPGFYTPESMAKTLQTSQLSLASGEVVNTSFVLVDEQKKVLGVRITTAPPYWEGKENTAYFKTVYVDGSVRGGGWARKLSESSIDVLHKAGIGEIRCHCWKESPGDASKKYLTSLGFEEISEHPLYWSKIDYVCTVCGSPCDCTAIEMVKYLYNN